MGSGLKLCGLLAVGFLLLLVTATEVFGVAEEKKNAWEAVASRLQQIATQAGGGRLGVAALDMATERRVVDHEQERFAMCSTFKFLAVAAVLHRVDPGEEKLDRFIQYTERDILAWAPVTKQHLHEGGMTVEALCFAAIAYSDNTAANLLLQTLGGPSGVTAYAVSLGDNVTRLDRMEPELNHVVPGDPRDTTSPAAMLADMQKILLGDALSAASREKLESWLVQNTTGDGMIRAGVPKDWRVGDKTGRSGTGNTNDIAIIRRPNGEAILLCIYVEAAGATEEQRVKMIADVTAELADTARLPTK
jgi:beta-lactamase class A